MNTIKQTQAENLSNKVIGEEATKEREALRVSLIGAFGDDVYGIAVATNIVRSSIELLASSTGVKLTGEHRETIAREALAGLSDIMGIMGPKTDLCGRDVLICCEAMDNFADKHAGTVATSISPQDALDEIGRWQKENNSLEAMIEALFGKTRH